ncbi:MAG: hypothetical protein RML93_12670 [Anaerolineales bacterium]|nr:hypothetical protein [Anaerolineales bacterium]MDW8448128.1 hypothetical protein [Anaerolineales bacterium]
MNKRLIILGVLLAALLLSAADPWPAKLTVWNYTGDNIYFTLKYRGEQKYFLTATPKGNTDDYRKSVFEVTRRKYSATVTACGTTTTSATLDLRKNVMLNFVSCTAMRRLADKFWGEPRMEKPNFFQGFVFDDKPRNAGKRPFRFIYELP